MSKRKTSPRTTPLHYQQADHRHPVARGDAPTRSTVNPYALLLDILNAREKQNTLPFLTPQRAQELFTAWRRGEIADVQLAWDQMEEFDETLATIRAARLGALAEMEWHIEIDATAVGDDPSMKQEAEAQQATLTRHLNAVENLDEALLHLGMADFRGVAALEITGNPTHYKWEPIEPWCLARPARRGPWFYNPDASPTPARLEEIVPESCIIREASPIDLPAMFLIVYKHHAISAWDAFLDVFGNPSIFLEMPPNTDEQRALEFDAKVQQIIGEGRGTIPNGTKFQTIETTQTDADAFSNRAKWCNEQLITLAMGGLLTVAAAPDSGTLAGNAHADSLARLAALSARSISATVQRQFCIPILRAQHPDRPILVRFILAPEEQEDKAAQAQLIATLAAAGYHPTAETVSELIGFEVEFTPPAPPADQSGGAFPLANATNAQEAPETLENARTDTLPQNAPSPSADPRQNSAGGHSGAEAGEIYNVQGTKYNLEDSRGDAAPGSPNRTTQDAAPLTEAELAAIQSIGKLSLDDLVRTDAATLAEGMLAAVEGVKNGAMLEEWDDEVIENCNQWEHDCGKSGDWKSLHLPEVKAWSPIYMTERAVPEAAREELTKGVTITDPLGNELHLGKRMLGHWGGKLSTIQKQRLSLLPAMKEVLAHPHEVWLNEEKGSRLYIGRIQTPEGFTILTGYTFDKENELKTYFPPTSKNKLSDMRKGVLLHSDYKRK